MYIPVSCSITAMFLYGKIKNSTVFKLFYNFRQLKEFIHEETAVKYKCSYNCIIKKIE